MGTCNCCNRQVRKFAWCDRCSPAVLYQGPTETGLKFFCRDHVKTIEIVISFELGEVADGD